MPFIFCPKCGMSLEIRDIVNEGIERKELYCTKCDFKKLYGS